MVALAAGIDADDELVTLDADLTASQGDLFKIGTTEIVAFRHYYAPYRFPRDINLRQAYFERGVRDTPKVAHLTGAVIAAFSDLTGGGGGGVTVTDPTGLPSIVATSLQLGGVVTEPSPGVAVSVPCVVSDNDPGAIGTGNFWLKTLAGVNTYQLYVRNENNDGWIQASAGADDGGSRQFGRYDSGAGDFIGLTSDGSGRLVRMSSVSSDGNITPSIRLVAEATEGVIIAFSGNVNPAIRLSDNGIVLVGLPTSDPGVGNKVWRDAGVLKITAAS